MFGRYFCYFIAHKWKVWVISKLTIRAHLLGLRSCLSHRNLQFWILYQWGSHIHGQHLPSKCNIYGNLLGGRVVRKIRHVRFHRQLGKRILRQLLQFFFKCKSSINSMYQYASYISNITYPHFCIRVLDRPTYRHVLHDRKLIRVSIDILRLHRSNNSRKRRICFRRQRYRTGGGSVWYQLVVLFSVTMHI